MTITTETRPRIVNGSGMELAFLSVPADAKARTAESAKDVFEALAEAVAEHGIEPVQEKVYGRVDAREEVLAARKKAFAAAGLNATLPCSYHQGMPVGKNAFAGVQLWGIIPSDDGTTVTTTREGRLWKGRGYRALYVPGINGLTSDGRSPGNAPEEAVRMFAAAEKALAAQGFAYRNVARTWIYMKRMLEWYKDFNRVRTAFYTERGVGTDAERSFPASTGIQGTMAGEEVAMDLLAVDGPGAKLTPVHSSTRQDRSFNYGSAFSRAMRLEAAGTHMVFISGTASIDAAGRSVYLGDTQGQVVQMLLSISALLEPLGAGLGDIKLSTLFVKRPEALPVYREVVRLLGIPDFPVVPVVADVCREELLVEVEAMAAFPGKAHRG